MRRHLTYANVAATLALVFAMSSGALAAKHYLIESTKQINPKVIKKLRGKSGATGKTGAAGAAGAPGKEGVAGKNGERGPSVAFNSLSETILGFPGVSGEPLTVASLNLPAGNFAILGKVLINNNSAATITAECQLLLGATKIDGVDVIRMEPEGKADRQYAVYSGTGTLSSPGTATISCKVSTTEGNYLDRTITATQVGALG